VNSGTEEATVGDEDTREDKTPAKEFKSEKSESKPEKDEKEKAENKESKELKDEDDFAILKRYQDWKAMMIEGPRGQEEPFGFPVGVRIASAEGSVGRRTHFIESELRPDLSRGALRDEPDRGGPPTRDPKEAKDAKGENKEGKNEKAETKPEKSENADKAVYKAEGKELKDEDDALIAKRHKDQKDMMIEGPDGSRTDGAFFFLAQQLRSLEAAVERLNRLVESSLPRDGGAAEAGTGSDT
jgi:hypothetical protein